MQIEGSGSLDLFSFVLMMVFHQIPQCRDHGNFKTGLVTEMTETGEDHGEVVLVTFLDG
jgi:hypothetical protein